MSLTCFRGALVALLLPLGLGIQAPARSRAHKALQSSSRKDDDLDLEPIFLDEQEVEERGSHCIDGSVPAFYFKEGTYTGKWVFWMSTNEVCANASICEGSLELEQEENFDSARSSKALQKYGDFANYHHVQVGNCDSGFYMGNKDDPVNEDGTQFYFQGGRIIKHIIDTLLKDYTMTDVLFAGGSGGGMSLYAAKYMIKSLMPDTVERFGIAPMNGWYEELDGEAVAKGYEYHEMSDNLDPECKGDYAGAEYNCLNPPVSYGYDDINVFVVQLFDYTFNKAHPEVLDDWTDCLYEMTNCTNEKAANVKSFWTQYLSNFSNYARYNEHGQGGFISTCTTHTFYNSEEDFSSFKSGGVTVGEAVWNWWESLKTGSSPAQWYMPCDMGDTAETLQCESTCLTSSDDEAE